MIKVFVVEDEAVVREGLRKKIKWAELGLWFAGEAADGELAYPMIQETKPDILITDIRMPFVDGLQLSKLVKEEMPWVKIVVVSGHDDFEYAQKAIAIGVAEYLLKPVNSAQFTETIMKIKTDIEREREQEKNLKQFHNEMLEYEKLEQKQFFKELVSGRLSVSELFEKGRRLNLSLSATGYSIILFQLSPSSGSSDLYPENLIDLERKIGARFAEEPQTILFERDLEGFALLTKGSGTESADQVTKRCLSILHEIVQDDSHAFFFAAVGTVVLRLAELPSAFEEVRQTFVYRYILGPSGVLYTHQTKDRPLPQDGGLSFASMDPAKLDKQIVERFLKYGSLDESSNFVSDYFSSIGQEHLESMLFRQYITIDSIFTVISFVEELGGDRQQFSLQFGDQSRLAEALSSVGATQQYLTNIVSEAVKLREASASQKYSLLLENARSFINKNYSSDDISLHTVAASVNISPSHFSTIFSQETGVTFIEYLTRLRMEKAMELLRCSSMKTAEIGYAVGYRDPHYFSYLFKKRLGYTPKEFRTGGPKSVQ